MWFVVALLGAGAWGTADFVGGIAARRTPALAVLVLSTPMGLLVVIPAVVWDGWTSPGLAQALLAGMCGGIGMSCLYAALGIGPMNVVAPASAVTGALVPVVAGLAAGERPGAWSIVGILVALCAVGLISREPEQAAEIDAQTSVSGRSEQPAATMRKGLMLALVAGLGIGLSLVFLEHAAVTEVSGVREVALAPLLPARLAEWGVVVASALVARTVVARKDARALAATAGALEGVAYTCYLLALNGGLLSVVGVLVSLYPAGTVLLARIVLGERTSRVQNLGLGLAAAGVVLMVVG